MRAHQFVLLLVAICIAGPAVQAQQLCPCVPVSHQWIVTACETWNCAVSAAVLADGSADVVPMPSGSDDFKWVVLRRVATGSATIPPDAPFQLEAFATLAEASARFATIDTTLKPILFTAPDGHVIVVMRAQPERRRATTVH